tara:strand:- start:392 stop:2239 length:1848 start_codon:yes stop_codon:yes gene_type:complete
MKRNNYNYNNGINALQKASSKFPNGSGVYKFVGENKNVLYVGKAKNLKKRISSYLNEIRQTIKIKTLISLSHQIDFIKTFSEVDSLILENNLIKELKPAFNVRLTDDKSFPYITIDKSSNWPRIKKYRGKQNKNDIFFGPFSHVSAVDEVLKCLEKAFLIRSCSDGIFKSRKRPCILYQIKRCCAPCVGLVESDTYMKLVEKAVLFLKGKNSYVKNELVEQMKSESQMQNFEQAAILRDRIKALTKISHEKYSDLNNTENFDVICCLEKFGYFCVQIFFFRSGRNLGNKEYFLSNSSLDDLETIFSQFIIFFYTSNIPPKTIYTNLEYKNLTLLNSVIVKNSKSKVVLREPNKGKKLSLIKMVEQNILISIENKFNNQEKYKKILKNLKSKLDLKNIPRRIEIYDNSHLNGTNPVGVMVVFQDYGFAKKLYKKFNISSNQEKINDDYFMMNQVLERRFTLLQSWKRSLPQLIIIDGGKGHLNKITEVFKRKNIKNIDIISIAKTEKRNAGNETIYTAQNKLKLPKSDELLFFLQRLRDEAHRFAVSSQKIKRNQIMKNSIFDNIHGIGKKLRNDLLSYFGSIENVKSASIDELKKAPGVGEKIAEKIYEKFNKNV